jgi:uncharacterized protein YdaU (DUF1376 family)
MKLGHEPLIVITFLVSRMAGKPPYFPLYVKDFAADSKVELMSTEEVGAYILLLCKAWLEEPAGSLPANDKVLARWARMDLERWLVVKFSVLSPFFVGTDGRWYQKRMLQEIDKLRKISRSRSKAADARWSKPLEEGGQADAACKDDAKPMQVQYDSYGSDSASGSDEKAEKKESAPNDSALPCHNPELVTPARDIRTHYDRVVGSVHKHGDVTITAIITALRQGVTKERLAEAIMSYAAMCDREGIAVSHRKSCLKFFEARMYTEDFSNAGQGRQNTTAGGRGQASNSQRNGSGSPEQLSRPRPSESDLTAYRNKQARSRKASEDNLGGHEHIAEIVSARFTGEMPEPGRNGS